MLLSITCYICFYYPCTFLHLLGTGLTEESGCSLRGGPEIRGQSSASGVPWARKDGGGGGKIRGGGFLWASEGSNVMFLHILSPTSLQESPLHTICHHLPSTPSGVPRTQSFWSCQTSTRINLCNCSSSSRGRDTSQYATPSYPVEGALRESIDVRLRATGRVHQPPIPPSVCTFDRCI